MHLLLRRLPVLLLAAALLAAPAAEAVGAEGGPVAEAAKKAKKKKKCKKKAKKGKRKAKCKRVVPGGGGGGAPSGLPGKPVNPNPPDPLPPMLLSGMRLLENPLLGGSAGSGEVTLNRAAPSGGQVVTLGSDSPTRVSVPDSVHVAAGQTSASFPITTTVGSPEAVRITAAVESSVRTVQLDLVDEESLRSLTLDYQCFPSVGLTDFGANVVALDVRAPDNVSVDLSSSDPFSLAVPPSVTVPADAFTGVFTIDTLATTPAVTVTASYDGDTATDTASVRDASSPQPVPAEVTFSPASIVVGEDSTGLVSLDCEAPVGGVLVTLATTYPGVTIPSSVMIPYGELSAPFSITTVPSATPGIAQIRASAGTTVQGALTLRAIGS